VYAGQHMSEKGDGLENHISLVILWNYHAGSRPLSNEEMVHISNCTECLSVLGLCQISKSIQEVESELKRRRY
jgi:hypothetical protein